MSAALSDPELVEAVLTRRRWRQTDLARIAAVHKSAVSRWRSGRDGLSASHRAALLYLLTAGVGNA